MLARKVLVGLLTVVILVSQSACGRLGSRGGRVGPGAAPHFKPGFNLFKPEQDVQLGQDSARQIMSQTPLLRDESIVNYVRQLGARLVAKAPGFKFPYEFRVVATREINAFALPGGPVFVNAGAIISARNEGELAGVMAHEIVHVALRHGTNQASKAYLAKAGLEVLGAVAGGQETDVGQIVNVIGGAGANAIFLKFSRTAETEADLEGARIMAEAGYDPRDMANFFKTLQEQSGGRVPEMLSDHPDPGNRIAAIDRVLPSLPVSANPIKVTADFSQAKARLTGGRGGVGGARGITMTDPSGRSPNAARPEAPSTTFVPFQSNDGSFVFERPENWDGLSAAETNLIFAPRGAYGRMGDTVMVTHGIFIGAVAPEADDLESANSAFVQRQLEANADYRILRASQTVNLGDRQAIATVVGGPSPVTGVTEIDVIYVTATSDGRLFYLITIVPEDEYQDYKAAFERVVQSLRVN